MAEGNMAAAGWYADPWSQAPLRWWDGSAWTGYTQEALPPPPSAATTGPSEARARLARLIEDGGRVAVVDVETTGLYKSDRVVEIAVVTMDSAGAVTDVFETLVNPGRDVGPTWLHRVTASMVADAPAFGEVAHHVASRLDGAVVVAHNLPFDRRMLTAEFDAVGIDIHWGDGLDTLRVTGCRLGVACSEHGVTLAEDAHSALADAHATAQLLLAVANGFPSAGQMATARPLEVRPMRVHTRSGSVLAGVPAPYLVALAQGVHTAPDVAPYVALLDRAIADLQLTTEERSELAEVAADLGLDPARVARAHRDFIGDLVVAALDDHIVTEDEYDQLCRAAALLDVDVDLIAQRTDGHRSQAAELTLVPGMAVCFTGVALDGRGRELPRPELEAISRARGLVPTSSVTAKACDLLVASDPSSQSGKAGKARKYGVPIASVSDFISASEPGAALRVSRLASAGTALVCTGCGASWLAARRSAKPLCADCRPSKATPPAAGGHMEAPQVKRELISPQHPPTPPGVAVVQLPQGPRQCPVAGAHLRQSAFVGYSPGPVMLELRSEPTNTYNRNAIAVYLPDGKQAGYLPDWILEDYGKWLHQIAREGQLITVGVIDEREGTTEAGFGLMDLAYLRRWTAASNADRATMPTREFNMKLAGTKTCLDAITAALGSCTTQKTVPVKIRAIETPSGKYKGQPRLDFFHQGEKLGHLLPTRQEQIPAVFEAAAAGDFDGDVVLEHSHSSDDRVFFAAAGRMGD